VSGGIVTAAVDEGPAVGGVVVGSVLLAGTEVDLSAAAESGPWADRTGPGRVSTATVATMAIAAITAPIVASARHDGCTSVRGPMVAGAADAESAAGEADCTHSRPFQ
jgi:hypothetical protein